MTSLQERCDAALQAADHQCGHVQPDTGRCSRRHLYSDHCGAAGQLLVVPADPTLSASTACDPATALVVLCRPCATYRDNKAQTCTAPVPELVQPEGRLF
ncbi:hypothetical protein GCM10009839_86660 [Catenulispora yoronensis]|uniref:Uncharacterized protein n=1 Tax=Catenulispora yoronensis TaxID=450799 RepID=A0ABN2VM13_9ACTN